MFFVLSCVYPKITDTVPPTGPLVFTTGSSGLGLDPAAIFFGTVGISVSFGDFPVSLEDAKLNTVLTGMVFLADREELSSTPSVQKILFRLSLSLWMVFFFADFGGVEAPADLVGLVPRTADTSFGHVFSTCGSTIMMVR